VTSGYSGGYVKSPSYESVSMGVTGHAETVSIIYDPSQLTYGQLLRVFFLRRARSHAMESPGSGHRLPIPLRDFLHQCGAEAHNSGLYRATRRLEVYSRPIVTKVEPFQAFYPAESYHQDFLKHNPDNPYIVYNDLPKLENLKKDFPNIYQP